MRSILFEGNVQYQAGQYEDDAVTSDLVASQINSGVFSEEDLENLFRFARHGRCEEIDSLFTRGIPVDTKDSFGNTVLTTACQNGNKRVAKTALRYSLFFYCRCHG